MIKILKVSTKSMVTAFDVDGKPILEFTGMLADVGPLLKKAYPHLQIKWGDLSSQL